MRQQGLITWFRNDMCSGKLVQLQNTFVVHSRTPLIINSLFTIRGTFIIRDTVLAVYYGTAQPPIMARTDR